MPWYLTVFDVLTSDSVLCLDIWFSLCVDILFTSMHCNQVQSDSAQCLDISFSPKHWHLVKSYTLTTGLILCTDIRFNFMHWYMIQSYALINVWCIVIWVSLISGSWQAYIQISGSVLNNDNWLWPHTGATGLVLNTDIWFKASWCNPVYGCGSSTSHDSWQWTSPESTYWQSISLSTFSPLVQSQLVWSSWQTTGLT